MRVNIKGKCKLSWNQKCICCMLPSLAGVAVFALLPFMRVLYYSFIKSQFLPKFVWFDHYVDTWKNKYFQLAFKNSMSFIVRNIPVLISLAIIVSIMLTFVIKKNKWISTAFILPMVIPTAGIVVVWKLIFEKWVGTLPIDLLFIWKNVGICIILLTAGFVSIPSEVFDAARMDGANTIETHIFITIPMSSATILFTTLLAVMNSYKIYKESYLYYTTSYPPDYAYTLQYYMNNHFLKLDYQSLAASSVYATLISILFIAVAFRLIERYKI